MSPLVWDLGHIAAFEDLWIVHRYGGRPLLRDELMDVYDAFETPRAQRGIAAVPAPAEARDYLDEVHERSLEVLDERGEDFVAELVAPPRATALRDDAADARAGAAARLHTVTAQPAAPRRRASNVDTGRQPPQRP